MSLVARKTDPHFNDAVAKSSYDLVMKMDLDEARMLTTAVVLDVMDADISKNFHALQKHLDEVVAKRIEQFKQGVSNSVLSKRMNDEEFDEGEALATAGAVAVIEKAVNQYSFGFQFDESDVRRGRDGRFSVKVKPETTANPMHRESEHAAGIAQPRTAEGRHLTGQQRANYQAQYLQIAAALDQFASDDDDVSLVVRRPGGNVIERPIAGKKSMDNSWDPDEEDVVGVQVAPKNLKVGGAAFLLGSALGASPETSGLRAGQVTAVDRGLSDFANEWNTGGDADSANARLYSRMAAGGKFVGQVAPTGSQAQIAGAFAEFAGRQGANAEKVIGPSIRRNAARYRGVEKEPDADIKAAYEGAFGSGATFELNDQQRQVLGVAQRNALAQARTREANRLSTSPSSITLPESEQQRIKMDVYRQAVDRMRPTTDPNSVQNARLAAVRGLQAKMPDRANLNLNLNAGNTPPSEGVIVDRRGKVVAQGIGYGDDHFLPFNLKQLKSLKGGEYIRTRSGGGPTTEDISTALMSGAHALTVTSPSGTFIVEFEDDFEGKRRYNDKAKRMVDRYGKLLDAVQSGQVKKPGGLPERFAASIRADIAADDAFMWASKDEIEAEYDKRVDEFRRNPKVRDEEVQALVAQELAANPDLGREGQGRIEAMARAKLQAAKELNYQLNGRGYESALKALQEQFPYYIKSARRVGEDDMDEASAGRKDRGYVKPRYNRPAQAQAGYFDASITGSAKTSADKADYQNLIARRKSEATPRQEAAAEQTSGEPVKAEHKKDPKAEAQKAKASISLGAVSATIKRQVDDFVDNIGDATEKANAKRDLSAVGTPDELESEIARMGTASPRYKALMAFAVDEQANADVFFGVGDNEGKLKDGKSLLTRLRTAQGNVVENGFDKSNLFVAGSNPYTFKEYENLDAEGVRKEMARLDNTSVFSAGQQLSDMSEPGLREEIEGLAKLSHAVDRADALAKDYDDEKAKIGVRRDRLEADDFDPRNRIVIMAMNNKDRFKQHAEEVQRMRALKKIADDESFPTPRQATSGAPADAETNAKSDQQSKDFGSFQLDKLIPHLEMQREQAKGVERDLIDNKIYHAQEMRNRGASGQEVDAIFGEDLKDVWRQ